MTLPEFLLARIAEDEAEAQRARKTWRSLLMGAPKGSSGHVQRWDPYYVQVECEAKRRIVATMQEAVDVANDPGTIELSAYTQGDLLKLLALPYADHADYREEWRP